MNQQVLGMLKSNPVRRELSGSGKVWVGRSIPDNTDETGLWCGDRAFRFLARC